MYDLYFYLDCLMDGNDTYRRRRKVRRIPSTSQADLSIRIDITTLDEWLL